MLSVFIPGTPVPQGSKRWLPNGGMIEANKGLRPWRATVASYLLAATHGDESMPLDGPVTVSMLFVFTRPKAHYGTGRNAGMLKPNAPQRMMRTPDIDKLVRAIADGITDAGVWRDDSQMTDLYATKRYGEKPGVTVEMRWEK